MTLYLNARCGSIQMLINVDRVIEVFDPPKDQSLSHLYNWRDHILPVIHMPDYFGMTDVHIGRLMVVDSGLDSINHKASGFVVLAVEASEKLLSLEDADINDMADYSERLADIFSGIYSPNNSLACSLKLRFPATWMLPVISGAKAA